MKIPLAPLSIRAFASTFLPFCVIETSIFKEEFSVSASITLLTESVGDTYVDFVPPSKNPDLCILRPGCCHVDPGW